MVDLVYIKSRNANTLIEMSIMILIFGMLLVGVIELQISIVSRVHQGKTIESLQLIEKAINQYVIENQQLPCPAKLKIRTNNEDNGKEERNGNFCNVSQTDGLFRNSNGI